MSAVPTTAVREPTFVLGGYAVDVAALTAAQKKLLQSLAARVLARLTAQSSLTLEIDAEGHTDITGSEAHNKQLGLRRATGVVDYVRSLVHEKAKDRVTYSTRSLGFTNPVVPNTSSGNRAKNRRVELTLRWTTPTPPARTPSPARQRPRPRPTPPRRPPPTAACVDYFDLQRRFGVFRAELQRLFIATRLWWPGEGQPITLDIAEPRTFREIVTEAVTDAVTETITEEVQDKLMEHVLGEDLALQVGAVASGLDFFAGLHDDLENERLMNFADRSMDDERFDKQRRLVAATLADSYIRRGLDQGGLVDKPALYLYLYRTWKEIERLQQRCHESRGDKNLPILQRPPPGI